MRAGPKRAVTASPLDLSRLPADPGDRAVAFIHRYLRIPKGKGALRPVRLRPWQVAIVRGALRRGVRQGLVAMPRANGKTTLAAMLGLVGLFDGGEGARVYTVAADERQARLSFDAARRMVELNPELADRVQIFQDRVYLPHTDSVMAPLPAEAHRLQGLDPTLVIVDELASVEADVYDAVALAAGKRHRSLTLAISTPDDHKEGPMWRLVEHGREGADPAFFFVEYAADDGCEVDDEEQWAVANPALGDFLSLDAMRATLRTSRESVFRRFRLGQWVGTAGSWLEWGAWDARADPERVVADGERVVLAFDGSASGDSTALVGCTLERPHVFLVGLWEDDRDPRWRVDRRDVDGAVEAAFDTYDVIELACDPWGWRSEIEAWSARWPGRVMEWPTNVASRMAPATDRLYQAIAAGTITNDGDGRLSAHVRNCVARSTPLGDLVAKDRRESMRKIDAAVAAIVAFDRAAWWAARPLVRKRVASF